VFEAPTQVTPDEPPLARRRWFLPSVCAVAVIAVAAVVLVRLDVIGGSSASPGPVSDQLARRMATVLEQLPPEQHDGHGGHAGTGHEPAKQVCAARVYGYEPASAATVDDVVTVYGFHLCGLAEPGRPWDWATKSVAPLVMRFDTEPPTVTMAEATPDVPYRERVEQLIPARYQRLALEGALEPKALADLRRRYAAASGT
jgi:hypothetical protein